MYAASTSSSDCHRSAHERDLCMRLRKFAGTPDLQPKRAKHNQNNHKPVGSRQQQSLFSGPILQDNSSSSSSCCAPTVHLIKQDTAALADDKLPNCSTEATAVQLAGQPTLAAVDQPNGRCASSAAAAEACPASASSTASLAEGNPVAYCASKSADSAGPSASHACVDCTGQAFADDAAPSSCTPRGGEDKSAKHSVSSSSTINSSVEQCVVWEQGKVKQEAADCTCNDAEISRPADRSGAQHGVHGEDNSKVAGKPEAVDECFRDNIKYSKHLLEKAAAAQANLLDPSNKLHLYMQLLCPCMGQPLAYILLGSLVTRQGSGGRRRQEHSEADCGGKTDKQMLRIVKNRESAARSKLKEKINKELPAMLKCVQDLGITAPKMAELISSTLHKQLFDLFQQYPIHSAENPVYIPQRPQQGGAHASLSSAAAAAKSAAAERQGKQQQRCTTTAHAAVAAEVKASRSATRKQQNKHEACQDSTVAAASAAAGGGRVACARTILPGAPAGLLLGKRRAAAAAEAAITKLTKGEFDKAAMPAKARAAGKQKSVAAAVSSRANKLSRKVPQEQFRLAANGSSGAAAQSCGKANDAAAAAVVAVETREAHAAAAAAGKGSQVHKPSALLIPGTVEEAETVQSLLLLAHPSKAAHSAPQGKAVVSSATAAPPALPVPVAQVEPQGLRAALLPAAKPQAQAACDRVEDATNAEPPRSTGSSGSAAASVTSSYITPDHRALEVRSGTASETCGNTTRAHRGAHTLTAVQSVAVAPPASVAVRRPAATAGTEADASRAASSYTGTVQVDNSSSAAAKPPPQQQHIVVKTARLDGYSRGVWQMMPRLTCTEQLNKSDVQLTGQQQRAQQQQRRFDGGHKITVFSSRNNAGSRTLALCAAPTAASAGAAADVKPGAAAAAFLMAQSTLDAMQCDAPDMWNAPTCMDWAAAAAAGGHGNFEAQPPYTAQQQYISRPCFDGSCISDASAAAAGTLSTVDSACAACLPQGALAVLQPFVHPSGFNSDSFAVAGARFYQPGFSAGYGAVMPYAMAVAAAAASSWGPAPAAMTDSLGCRDAVAPAQVSEGQWHASNAFSAAAAAAAAAAGGSVSFAPSTSKAYSYSANVVSSAAAASGGCAPGFTDAAAHTLVQGSYAVTSDAVVPPFRGVTGVASASQHNRLLGCSYDLTNDTTLMDAKCSTEVPSAAQPTTGCFMYTDSKSSSSTLTAVSTAAAAAYDDDAVLAASIAADMEFEDATEEAQADSRTSCGTSMPLAGVLCDYDTDGDRVMFSHPGLGSNHCTAISGMGALLLDPLQMTYGL